MSASVPCGERCYAPRTIGGESVNAVYSTRGPNVLSALTDVFKGLGVKQLGIFFLRDRVELEELSDTSGCMVHAAFKPFCGDHPLLAADFLPTCSSDSLAPQSPARKRIKVTREGSGIGVFVRDDSTAEEAMAPTYTESDYYYNFVGTPQFIVVDTKGFSAVLKNASRRKTVLRLALLSNVPGGENEKINIAYTTAEYTGSTSMHGIPINYGGRWAMEPKTYDYSVDLPTMTFKTAVETLANHSEDSRGIRFALVETENGGVGFRMSKSGTDGLTEFIIKEATGVTTIGGCRSRGAATDARQHDEYAIRYLIQVSKLHAKSPRITLHWGNAHTETALRIGAKFHDAGECVFYIGPLYH
jgi:hypothetical protein